MACVFFHMEICTYIKIVSLHYIAASKFLQSLTPSSVTPDVVGEIRSVQGSDLGNDAATTRDVILLLIEPDVTVYLSLWDEAASTFRDLLKAGDKTKSVMLVTTVNPKLFGGNLYLNSTPGTCFFFDTSLPEIAEFVSRVGGESSKVFPLVDTLQGIKKELVSIADLNTFISNSNAQTQEADFLCKARIVGVIQENGWSFVACTGCNKKLERSGTSLSCNRCVTDAVTGVVRFRVELAVDDGNDNATFVVFDKEMTKLTKQDAAVLALEEVFSSLRIYIINFHYIPLLRNIITECC
ncbi:BnaA10g27590D [Brassica napus]|uniref:BnaA10g27590D protein n=1 Tax=Brassica napus TaxID=3708 RepID=A0A078HSP6_BRANA|nr:BnaA10g27590D [Brassica napus]